MINIFHSTNVSTDLKPLKKAKNGSWIHVVEPTEDELEQLCNDYKLEIDLLRDANDLYETPRVERDEGSTYVFARYCFPQGIDIATEPILIIYTKNNLITIQRRKHTILDRIINGAVPVATTQKTKTFLQILAAINYSYERHMYSVNKHIIGLRGKLSKTDIRNEYFIEFIDIEENLNEYLTALQPQSGMYKSLLNGRFLPLFEADKDLVEDLLLTTTELIDLIKSRIKTISNIRDAYSTIMANNLNRIFKRLTSIGIFLTVPTIVASLYGMNVELPNADSGFAFFEIMVIIALATGGIIVVFKRLKWL